MEPEAGAGVLLLELPGDIAEGFGQGGRGKHGEDVRLPPEGRGAGQEQENRSGGAREPGTGTARAAPVIISRS